MITVNRSLDQSDDCVVFGHEELGDLTVYSFHSTPFAGINTYVFDDFAKLSNSKITKGAVLLDSSSKKGINTSVILIAVCEFFWKYPDEFYHGGCSPSLGKIHRKSEMSAFYVTHPYIFASELMNEKYFMLVAISAQEVEFLEEHGGGKLEEHFRKNKVDIFNLFRKSSV